MTTNNSGASVTNWFWESLPVKNILLNENDFHIYSDLCNIRTDTDINDSVWIIDKRDGGAYLNVAALKTICYCSIYVIAQRIKRELELDKPIDRILRMKGESKPQNTKEYNTIFFRHDLCLEILDYLFTTSLTSVNHLFEEDAKEVYPKIAQTYREISEEGIQKFIYKKANYNPRLNVELDIEAGLETLRNALREQEQTEIKFVNIQQSSFTGYRFLAILFRVSPLSKDYDSFKENQSCCFHETSRHFQYQAHVFDCSATDGLIDFLEELVLMEDEDTKEIDLTRQLLNTVQALDIFSR